MREALIATMAKFACAIGIVLAVAACTPPANRYIPDPSLTAETGATVVGSEDASPNPFRGDLRTVISSIDGRGTGNSIFDWDKSILVAPGTHTIAFSSKQGNGHGGLTTQLTFEAGKAYVLRGQRNGLRRATVWLEEQGSGTAVSDKFAVCFSPSVDPVAVGFLAAAIVKSLDNCK